MAGTNYDEASGLRLNPNDPNTGLPTQMTDAWLRYVFDKIELENSTLALKLRLKFNTQRNIISKYVSAIDKSTGELYICRLVDGNSW